MSSLHCMYIGHPGVVLFSLLFSLYANDSFSKDLSVRIVMFDDGLKSALSRTQMWSWTAGPVGQSDQPRAEYAQNCSSNSGVEESLSIMPACHNLPRSKVVTPYRHYYQRGRAEPAPAQEVQPASGGDDLFNSGIIQYCLDQHPCRTRTDYDGQWSLQEKQIQSQDTSRQYHSIPSGRCYRAPFAQKSSHLYSSFPQAITLINI